MSEPSPSLPSVLERVRATYREISLYAPDRSPSRLDVSDNTNLFGVPPAALASLRGAAEGRVTRYPSLYAGGLKGAIASYIGVDPSCVVTGCGSDDVLDSAIRAFCEPGSRVATSDPSFAMIPLFALMNGLEVAQVHLTADHDIDAAALARVNAAVTYVCSPNNPTGGAVSNESLRTVLRSANGVVIVDEAYAEFARSSIAPEAPALKNVLAVRTLSKAFGLAGLRIGYAIGAPELVAEVEKSRGPYKVSALAEEAATLALTEDLLWVHEHIHEVLHNRARFAALLRERGYTSLPSDANFLLVPVAKAGEIAARMRAGGVAVRPFTALAGIGDALRISIGPWPLMVEVLDALDGASR